MKLRAIALSLFTSGLVATSCDALDETTPERRKVDGPALYAQRCALCHGDKGQGYAADNANALGNASFLSIASDDFLRRSIERGRPGTSMSAWGVRVGGPLEDDEIDAIIKHIRGFTAAAPLDVDGARVSGEAMRAQAFYDVKCKSCHGEKGSGGEHMTVANPEFLAIASDGYLRQSIRDGRPGTPMPAFAAQLTDQVIDDLVVLIRSWQVSPDAMSAAPPIWQPSDAIINPAGPAPSLPDGRFVSVDVVQAALMSGARLVLADARAPTDYVAQHIEKAISVPFYEADKYLDKLPRDATIVAYCGCPHAASGALADQLEAKGFSGVKVLDEGYYVWRDRGYPVKAGVAP